MRSTLLLGSIPLQSASEVFEAVGTHMGDVVPCIPDGETGERLGWVTWYYEKLLQVDGLDVVAEMPIDGPIPVVIRSFRLQDGWDAADLELHPLGYSAEAIASYQAFTRARSAGLVPKGTRFQVCIPSPAALALMIVDPSEEIVSAFERAVVAEVADICDAIPPEDLAVQWDVVCEIGGEEYRRRAESAKPHLQFMAQQSANVMSFARGIESIARISDAVPEQALVGLHLCFGDADGEHVIEPLDLSVSVEFSNAVMERAERRIDWVHMAVPMQHDDDAYFRPLERLSLDPGGQLYLGLLHQEDGAEGAARRMAVAQRHASDFGIATECGLGRIAPKLVPDLLELHRTAALLDG